MKTAQPEVRSIATYRGKIYLATNLGLLVSSSDSETFEHVPVGEGLRTNNISHIGVHGDRLYVSSPSQGVTILNLNYVTQTAHPLNELASPQVSSTVVGVSGRVYIATSKGLSLYRDGEADVETRTTANGPASDEINHLVETGNEDVFVATAKGLSISMDFGRSFQTAPDLDGTLIHRVQFEGDRIYAATSKGLSFSDDNGQSFVTKTTEHGLPGDDVTCIAVEEERLYVATTTGLSFSDDHGQSFQTLPLSSLPAPEILDLSTNLGRLYVGTHDGLLVSRNGGQSFDLLTQSGGLPSNKVHQVRAKKDRLYVTYEDGAVEDPELIFRKRGSSRLSIMAFESSPIDGTLLSEGLLFKPSKMATYYEKTADWARYLSGVLKTIPLVEPLLTIPFAFKRKINRNVRGIHVDGDALYVVTASTVYRTYDDGRTFQTVFTSDAEDLQGMFSTDAALYIVGEGSFTPDVYESKDGGDSYHRVKKNSIRTEHLTPSAKAITVGIQRKHLPRPLGSAWPYPPAAWIILALSFTISSSTEVSFISQLLEDYESLKTAAKHFML